MFPEIFCLDDIHPFVALNPQIRIKTDELTGMTVLCYMVQDEDTFAGEHEHYERECRGLTFHADGRIAARTLHKFFNIGQREDVQPQNIQWQNVVRIMDKRDGSMVTPIWTGESVIFKTKKSFTTKEANLAYQVAFDTPFGLDWILGVLSMGFTPTFEITSPNMPIVLKYEKNELTLLHVRENISGRYLTEDELIALKSPFPIVENVIEKFYGDGVPKNLVSWEKLKEFAETATGTEGVVIQFANGDMVKLKTVWYCELHRSVTFTRWRDIARDVVADRSDDLKGAFVMTGRDIAPIVKVEREIGDVIHAARLTVAQILHEGTIANSSTAKDMALKYKDHELFGQIMRLFRGGEVDWMDWYAKNRLEQDWSLDVVGDVE